MRTCVYCDKPLPESTRKGGRRKEFCNDACKNRHYRQYKQIKHDADMVADPYWHKEYKKLFASYVKLGTQAKERIQKLEKDLETLDLLHDVAQNGRDYWENLYEELRIDYAARMKAQGISEKAIKEFNDYWLEQEGNESAYIERLKEERKSQAE